MLLSYDVLFFDVYLHVYVFIVTHIVFNFRSPPFIMDPADPFHNLIGKLTFADRESCNQGSVMEANGIDRLQSDAKRAFESFE